MYRATGCLSCYCRAAVMNAATIRFAVTVRNAAIVRYVPSVRSVAAARYAAGLSYTGRFWKHCKGSCA